MERGTIGEAFLAEGLGEELRCPFYVLVFLVLPVSFWVVCLHLLLEGFLVSLHSESEIGLATV